MKERRKPTAKEMLFCYYFHQLRNGREAAARAGYLPIMAENTAMKLLQRKDIHRVLKGLDQEYEKGRLQNDIISGLKRLAFGSVSDSMKLIFQDELPELEELDFFAISEIKKPKDGALEIKFFDRFKALEKLLEISEEASGQDGIAGLYHALEQSARIIQDQADENGNS